MVESALQSGVKTIAMTQSDISKQLINAMSLKFRAECC
ncbi:hypothetical protein C8J32_11128 [Rhizobium sp. PP-CC-3A-592]|nr:hypothetical protein C8J32_11128 [Rhizobium sp. PP-CC-3A-592]